MPLRTANWTQSESGMTLVLARDANFNSPISGLEEILDSNELHVVTTTQKLPIGSMIYDVGSDSVYRYVEYGEATLAGDMVQAAVPDNAHDDLAPNGSGTGAGVAKGDTIISIADSITLLENEYAGGFLYTMDSGTGVGYRYPIKSNEAVSSAANGNVTLWDPGLAVAVNGSSNVALIQSRYKDVLEAKATLTGVPVGASLGVGADGSFGWVQTRGPAAVLVKGTIVIANNVVVVTAAGSVGPNPSDLFPVVGWTMDVGADTAFGLIFLTLE